MKCLTETTDFDQRVSESFEVEWEKAEAGISASLGFVAGGVNESNLDAGSLNR
jgi:hypothetical protein